MFSVTRTGHNLQGQLKFANRETSRQTDDPKSMSLGLLDPGGMENKEVLLLTSQ